MGHCLGQAELLCNELITGGHILNMITNPKTFC